MTKNLPQQLEKYRALGAYDSGPMVTICDVCFSETCWNSLHKHGDIKSGHQVPKSRADMLADLEASIALNRALMKLAAENRDALSVAYQYMTPTNTSGIVARKQVKEQIETNQLGIDSAAQLGITHE